MTIKAFSKNDQLQVVEPMSKELNQKVIGELIDLIKETANQAEAKNQPVTDFWFYRVPFAGVRYYSFE